MDCNNYSYINYDTKNKLIKRYDDGDYFVEISEECNWFQDRYFTVWSDLEDSDGEWYLETFDFTLTPNTRRKALNRAKAAYNRLVGKINMKRRICA